MDKQVMWALHQASKRRGFTPNAASVADFAMWLERRGWLYRSQNVPTWVITPEGRRELDRLYAYE